MSTRLSLGLIFNGTAAITILGLCLGILYVVRPRKGLPPAPPQTLVLGNLHNFPDLTQAFLTFTKWAQTYGPIFHLRLFNKYFIVLNTGKAALDLLESRSNIYSDRPHTVFDHQVAMLNYNMFRMRVDHPRFRVYRRMMQSGIGPRALQGYRSLQLQERNVLLRNLVDNPQDFISHLRRNAGSFILKLTYGYDVKSNTDEFLDLIEKAFLFEAEKLSRPFIVEYLPFLRFFPSWFPLCEFKKVAKELRASQVEAIPFKWSKGLIESGNFVDSFVSRFLLPEDGSTISEEDQDILKWCAHAMYIGGGDTVVSAMTTFFYIMVMHPDIQKRAQADIDRTTGGERLPIPEDEARLPYVTAIIKELLRFVPVAPIGLNHRVMEDDEYEGYHIPKGSVVIGNIRYIKFSCPFFFALKIGCRAITLDPELYPNPGNFDPERHLGEHPETDPYKFVFGFGRRACPGSYLAERSLFLNIASILALFKLEKDTDANGNTVEPKEEFCGSVTM
ncbi:hypothetical protein VNI00_019270 [Paramarasmius palmivorus]|uniref:Cytochrome P450 n=1 Tax=Paramarasmius palmivorus TaxID=297713 RepID=A0AAW0AN99_9AGAR